MFSTALEVHDLDSGFFDWVNDTRVIIDGLANPTLWKRAVPAIPLQSLRRRCAELRHVCLITRQSARIARQLFSDVEPVIGGIANELEQLLQDDFSLAEADTRGDGEVEPSSDERESAAGPGRHPGTGRAPQDLRSVAIDHYGLYVGSLKAWLERRASTTPTGKNEMALLARIRSTPNLDSPAVLLCPERIRSLHGLIVQTARSSVRERLALESVTSAMYLKLTLLHELGHHVYPAHEVVGLNYQPDAMANWFAFGFLDARERHLLNAMTQTQAVAYRAYEGLLALLQPTRFGMPNALILPWSARDGEYLVAEFESRTFARRQWEERAVDRVWPDFPRWLIELPKTSPGRLGRTSALHASEVYASMLLAEALPTIGPAVLGCLSAVSRAWFPNKMTHDDRQSWSDRMSAEVRVPEPPRAPAIRVRRLPSATTAIKAQESPDKRDAEAEGAEEKADPEEVRRKIRQALRAARVQPSP